MPSVEREKMLEDYAGLPQNYKKLTDKRFASQAKMLAEIVVHRECSAKQFDQLLKEPSFLEHVAPGNRK